MSLKNRVFTLMAFASCCCVCPASAQNAIFRLYEGVAPGSEGWTLSETPSPNGSGVRNVRDPKVMAYLPDEKIRDGAAVILLPGGGLRGLSIGQETSDLIRFFNAQGVAVFVLKYRTLQVPDQPTVPASVLRGEFPKLVIRNANANPSPNDAALNEVLRLASSDAILALRILRRDAAKWKIDPKRIGFIGSSAGGGVALSVLLANEEGARPDFLISLYGPALQDVSVPSNAPPLFIATESKHGPVTDGLISLFSMWRDNNVNAEIHIFEVPSFKMNISYYEKNLIDWMSNMKISKNSLNYK